jgi:hypothetical protein
MTTEDNATVEPTDISISPSTNTNTIGKAIKAFSKKEEVAFNSPLEFM